MARISSAAVGAFVSLFLPFALAAAQQQGRDASDFTWSKQLAAGATLTIRNADGPIDVREATGDRVEVRAVKHARGSRASVRDVSFDVQESGGDVTICTVYDGSSLCDRRGGNTGNTRNIRVSVDFTVMIPRSLRLRVLTGNGDVSVDKAGAEVNATTGNGRISIGETTGRVDATTGNGDVHVESARGPVRVSTGNGRVFVATSSGPVNATSGNGDLDIRMKTLTSETGMTFTTGNGHIRLTVPEDFNADVEMSTGSGNLRSDFDIRVVGRLDPQHLRGQIGKGGPTVRLNTGSGTVEIRKG
jgi:hypothetical protein